MRSTRILWSLVVLLLFVPLARSVRAQNDPLFQVATQPYASYNGGNIDKVDLYSGNLSIHIPLISYPQRGGKLPLKFAVDYQSGPALVLEFCDPSIGCSLIPYTYAHGAEVVQEGAPRTWVTQTCDTTPTCSGYVYLLSLDMPDGAVHQMGPTTSGDFGTSTWRALDGSGYLLDYSSGTMTGPDGTQYINGGGSMPGFDQYSNMSSGSLSPNPQGPPPIPSQVTDTNGNQILTTYSNGQLTGWTDTLGRPYGVPKTDNPTDHDPNPCPVIANQPAVSSSWIWDLPGPGSGGGQYAVKFCAISFTVGYSYWDPYYKVTVNQTFSDNELQSIVLPDGTAWVFQYAQDGTGDLTQLTFPTGGSLSYTWGSTTRSCGSAYYCFGGAVASRTLNPGNGGPSGTWTYAYGSGGSPSTVTVTDPDQNQTVHTFTALDTYSPYETETQYYQGASSSGAILKGVTTSYQYSTPFDANNGIYGSAKWPLWGYAVNVMPKQVFTEWWSTAKQSEVAYSYDGSGTFYYPYYYSSGLYEGPSAPWTGTLGMLVTKQEYDYGTAAVGPLARTTTTNYMFLNNPSYLTANLLNLPSSVQVNNAVGTKVSLTDYLYDQPPNTTCTCGNLSETEHWLNTSGSYVDTYTVYDSNGDLIKSTDGDGNSTTYSYGSGYAGTGPTEVINALGQTTTFTYDFNTGLLTSVTDPNNQTTSYSHDQMLRTTAINYPDGGETTFTYNPPVSTETDIQIAQKIDSGGNWKDSTLVVDGLGRKIQTQLNSDPDGTDYVDTTYDDMGRVASVSNPYRTTSDPTYGVTTYPQYDGLGRPVTVSEADGSTITTSYADPCATTTDEAGKKRESCTDALGRLTEVIEDPGGLGYTTTYTYDALGNLTGVNENGQTRSFVYDSLSRLTSATNPESGTTSYTYDAAGNVLTKTDARNITTTYTYDALNRVTQKSYSDGTPVERFLYDVTGDWGPNQTNLVGRLSTTYTGSGAGQTAQIFSYDAMGRVVLNDQCTPLNCGAWPFPTSYTYDLLGDMTSYTNSQGVTFTQTFDTAGRPVSIRSSLSDSQHPGTLATVDPTIGYWPNEAIRKMTLGNGLTETTAYNDRFQPCLRDLNSSGSSYSSCTDSQPGGTVLNLSYGYDSGSADNGDVRSVAATGQQSYSRSFTYGPLNRLTGMSGTGGSCLGLSWTYDAWGNRTAQNATSGTCDTSSLGYDSTKLNNQIISPSGYQYDAAGDLINDANHTYTYDAAGRISAVDNGSTASYVYDAEGRRVRRTVGGVNTEYVYGIGGGVLDEIGGGCGATCWHTGYVYFGGRLLAEYKNGTTYFVTHDQLGSSSLLTNVSGGVADCNAFYPYGEQDSSICSTTNTISHKFTGKERDTESGNDYFGARYYSSSMGRFLSPDPLFIDAQRLTDPQSLNLYSYVRNNPLGLTDDAGLDFYLACQTSDHSGCGQVQNGDEKVWVQGQGTGKDFQAYDIDMNRDGSGLFSDQFGNDYKGTFDQNGVSFSSVASGGASGSGTFIEGSDQTDVNGSGLFSGLQGHFVSACGGSCEARGSLTGPASAFATMEGQLNRQSGLMSGLDLLSGAHSKGIQWKDSNGFIHVIQNGPGTRNAGITEMHFEGHPTGVDVTQFVLHMVDTIRDASNGAAAAQRNMTLPTGPAQ